MIALYLANFGLLHKPALYLSDYFERNKNEYIARLMAVRESDQLKQWLVFFLHGVTETARHSIQVFKDILALKQRLDREFLPKFSTRRQNNAQHLMQYLYQSPVLNVNDVVQLLDIPHNTAAALVRDFVKNGVLQEFAKRRRNRIYWFRDYLRIFTPSSEGA